MVGKDRKIYEFGLFRLDISERTLSLEGDPVMLTPKVFDLLVLLVENHGRLLEKEEIINELWAESFVEEANLNVNISALRRAIGETPSEQKFIETVPRRGYRFIAEVREVVESDPKTLDELTESLDLSAENRRSGINPSVPRRKFISPRNKVFVALFPVILIAAVIVLFWLVKGRYFSDRGVSQVRTIAILPFKPLTKGQDDEALEMGMADALAEVNG